MPINNWNFFRSVSACNDQKSWLSENPQVTLVVIMVLGEVKIDLISVKIVIIRVMMTVIIRLMTVIIRVMISVRIVKMPG